MKHSETCKHFNGFFERLFILLIKISTIRDLANSSAATSYPLKSVGPVIAHKFYSIRDRLEIIMAQPG